jgi:hypothetical protein
MKKISNTQIESNDLDIIAIYRSKDGSLKSLVDKFKKAINMSKSTLVIGDMNICNKKNPENELKTFLEDNKFKQIVKKATHIDGGHIDHDYTINIGEFCRNSRS